VTRSGHTSANGDSFHVSKDGTKIFFKDWGTGRPIVFSHGWPLDADAWDAQLLPKKLTFTLASPEAAVNIQIAPRGDEAV